MVVACSRSAPGDADAATPSTPKTETPKKTSKKQFKAEQGAAEGEAEGEGEATVAKAPRAKKAKTEKAEKGPSAKYGVRVVCV